MTAFSSLYTSASGLQALSHGMSVIGHNIANVSTTGYKANDIHFADVFNDTVVTGGGLAQLGKGVQLADLITDFDAGSLTPGTASTDLAIEGKGFFVISHEGSSKHLYTRAGAFRFDSNGLLKEPGGGVVQGYAITHHNAPREAGEPRQGPSETIDLSSLTDIRLAMNNGQDFVSQPERTTQVDMRVNLDALNTSSAPVQGNGTNPAFSLFEQWDAQASEHLAPNSFAYASPMTVYDEAGGAHTLTAYFDPVAMPNAGQGMGGARLWEYMLAVDPSEDGRAAAQGSSKAGLLMMGTLTFDASGTLLNQSAFTPQEGGALDDLAQWTAASMSSQGAFLCAPQFAGEAGATGKMGVNFGITDASPSAAPPRLSAGDVPADPQAALEMLGMVKTPYRFANTSTSFAKGSFTVHQAQDGYAEGSLESVFVDRDGVLTGKYSNGQSRSLFVLALANCKNPYDLERKGGNMFAETPGCGGMQWGVAESGNARFGTPAEAPRGLGRIASQSLESSNVDMAEEFVDMIITQKGFQANAKVVTTSDEILKMINQMKR